MSTYKVFVLQLDAQNNNPVIHTVFVSADKYGPAWGSARQLLNDGKPHKDNPAAKALYSDPELKVNANLGFGDHLTVAKIVDIKPRNVKVDKAALLAEAANTEGTPEEQLARLKALLLGAKPFTFYNGKDGKDEKAADKEPVDADANKTA